MKLPEQLLSLHTPVVLDTAYRSSADSTRFGLLMQQARAAQCATLEGLEVLFEQGCAQSEMWTGRPADRQAIAQALLEQRAPWKDGGPPAQLVHEANL